ncbi:ester cyclase [Phenylobacterium deserti]|uniref:Ester cyclase n=1 Tax=Phenylobacterium deserti TaxID=1914756 RepID=A0A328AE75_9CAUL|nr:ester cyclase [Phenylobacterium deserti]RAK52516.1 ester cyclase [Phenylobacterium deserti]
MNPDRMLPALLYTAALFAPVPASASPQAVVTGFLAEVRSGAHPERADRYFAPQVQAHQMTSEGESTVVRTPAEYADHVREFLALFGAFHFEVTETLAAGDKVYVRWRQQGRHLGSVFGERPTETPLTEISSAVYRVERGRIVEYWIQTDRKGLEIQIDRAEPLPWEHGL